MSNMNTKKLAKRALSNCGKWTPSLTPSVAAAAATEFGGDLSDRELAIFALGFSAGYEKGRYEN